MLRQLRRPAFLAMIFALVANANAGGQEGGKSRDELLAAARRIIASARFATLVTVDPEGQPQARIVDPFAPDSQMVIWIGTNPRTRKVAQIEREPRVALSYFDAKSLGYATILGRAQVVENAEEKRRHFKPEWADYYPDRDRDYVLIKVVPEALELISEKDGVGMVDPRSWRPPAVRF